MQIKYRNGLVVLAALIYTMPAQAHHSFSMFDQQKAKALVGTVKEFQWTNPHIWLQLNVVNTRGDTEEWGIEGSTLSILGRTGWTRHSFQPGDKVTVTIHPLKSGEKGGSFVKAVFADGRTLSEAPGVGGNSPQAEHPVERP